MSENKTKINKNDEIDDLEIEIKDKKPDKKSDKKKEEKEGANDESILVPKAKIALVKKLIMNIKENNDQLVSLLSAFMTKEEEQRIGLAQISEEIINSQSEPEDLVGSRIIEGVFDGEGMVGPDGKQYSIPANYASKSKLVEGDILKLTITPNGTFVYKQIGPIDRARLVGILEQNQSGNYIVRVEDKYYKVLTASVTYYKGQINDEVIILVPKNSDSSWAAVENIVRKLT